MDAGFSFAISEYLTGLFPKIADYVKNNPVLTTILILMIIGLLIFLYLKLRK